MPKRNIWHSSWQMRRWKLRRFLFLLAERKRQRNTLQSQNKNDILMTSPSSLSHSSRMLLGAMFVSSTWSKQRTCIKVVKHINTQHTTGKPTCFIAKLFWTSSEAFNTYSEYTREGLRAFRPLPPRHSTRRLCCHLTHPRGYKSNCIHSTEANCRATFHLGEEKYRNF
jgi:hypothetical protein